MSNHNEYTFLSQGTFDEIYNELNPTIEQIFKRENLLENNVDSTRVMTGGSMSTSFQPSMEDYPGPCNFETSFAKEAGERTKWEFSVSLNKLFVQMDCKIPFKFRCSQQEVGLFIRAVPVFLATDYYAEPIVRCPLHERDEKTNRDFLYIKHIIRCDHLDAIYQENPDSKRLSVLVPLDCPQPGSDWSTLLYSFVCKNSCSLGMNRRSTAVIFTLERYNGEVIGRKRIDLRICSCPKRDFMKEEKAFQQNLELEGCNEVEEKSGYDSQLFDNRPGPGKKRSQYRAQLKDVKSKKLCIRSDMALFQIRTCKSNLSLFAKVVKETVLCKNHFDELSVEDRITLQDLSRYICGKENCDDGDTNVS